MKFQQNARVAAYAGSVIPAAAVTGIGQKGQTVVEVQNVILNAAKQAAIPEGFELVEFVARMASALTEIYAAPLCLRALRAVLLARPELETGEVGGWFSADSMVEADGDIDLVLFELIDEFWDEFTFPNGRGGFAPLAECYIPLDKFGRYGMDPIFPTLPRWDEHTQREEWTPCSWVQYAQHYLKLDRQGLEFEDAENKQLGRHKMADLINRVKVSMKDS